MKHKVLACIAGVLAAALGTAVFLAMRASDGGASSVSESQDAVSIHDAGTPELAAAAPRVVDAARSEVGDPRIATVTVPESEAQTSAMQPRLHAVVISRESGAPLENAAVGPLGRRRGVIEVSTREQPLATSGTDGRLILPQAESGNLTMLFTAPRHAPSMATFGDLHVIPGPPLEVVLSRAATLHGTIILVGDQAGDFAKLTVILRARAGDVVQPRWSLSWGGDVEWSSEVDEHGRFVIGDAAPSVSLAAEVKREGEVLWASPERIWLTELEVREVTWEIGHAADVLVRAVEADGGPASRLDITLDVAPQKGRRYERSLGPRARRGLTSEDGTHIFKAIPDGHWCVSVAAKQSQPHDSAPAPALVRFDVDRVEESVEIVLPVHRGLYIRGVVLDWAGNPLSEQSVQAVGDEGGSMLGRAGADGNFSVGPLLPGGYHIRALTFGRGTNAPAIPVAAVAGQEGVVVQARRGGILAGLVIDASTREPLACKVSQSSTGGGGYTSHLDDGKFEMDGIAPGVCALKVITHDGRKALRLGIEMEPGQEIRDLMIEVEAATHLDLHYVGEAERVYAEIESSGMRIDGQWIANGSSVRLAVPPCAFVVKISIRDPDGKYVSVGELSDEVTAGESKRLDLSER